MEEEKRRKKMRAGIADAELVAFRSLRASGSEEERGKKK